MKLTLVVSNEKKEEIQSILNKIDEGLLNLKERTDFNILRHNEKVPEIETTLNLFRKTNNSDALEHVVDIFKKTGAAMMEGETSFDSTIWNANVQVEGKMVVLEHLFWELREIVDKE